ncbi:MAG: acetyl-CoA C-acyltransferase [Deltaproteobacteria bacterium]|nr:acetyl-CoA C-acyltransferase [Deltaproteobacteria bacterium]
MPNIVLCNALRSPIGRFQGTLSTVRPDDLLARVMEGVIKQADIDPVLIDEIFMGCANQAGEDNRNIARMSSLLAGIPQSVPGVTVNRLCASGLEAVVQGYRAARCGEGNVFLVGGVESMSRAPYSMPRGPQMPKAGNFQVYDTSLGWRYPNPKMEAMFPLEAMGCTAENVADMHNISREDQDIFALNSQKKAVAAIESGAFTDEIIPIEAPAGRRKTVLFSQDEGPRADSNLEKLASLRAVFRKGGTVTAGNSSTLNDGASAMLLTTEARAKELGLTPMARIISTGVAGIDPTIMGLGPVEATKMACKRAGITPQDLDLIELNEAFSAQSLGVIRMLNLDEERINVHGGAIALGHPLGCSGARILTTLLHAMKRHDKNIGLASLCVGVGQGLSVIVERYQ